MLHAGTVMSYGAGRRLHKAELIENPSPFLLYTHSVDTCDSVQGILKRIDVCMVLKLECFPDCGQLFLCVKQGLSSLFSGALLFSKKSEAVANTHPLQATYPFFDF